MENENTPRQASQPNAKPGHIERVKQLWRAGREDFNNVSLRGKMLLGGLMLMTAYEEGPGNETITPLVTGQVLGLEKGIGGVALTAGVAGGFVVGEQMLASYFARNTARGFPNVSQNFYENYMRDEVTGESNFAPFTQLPKSRQLLYALTLGSSFNVLRETAVTGQAESAQLKKVGHRSAVIAGGSVAAIGAGVEVVNQRLEDNPYAHFAVEWIAKNPFFWLGLMGATLGADYIKNRHRHAKAKRQAVERTTRAGAE